MVNKKIQRGFSLMELMIVVLVLGILIAVTYPNYINYIKKTKRTDMMVELQNIATQIEARKMVAGNYNSISQAGLTGNYPRSGTALYTVTINPLSKQWVIIAEPKAGQQMAGDGNLTLDFQGKKCHDTKCGFGDEWRK